MCRIALQLLIHSQAADSLRGALARLRDAEVALVGQTLTEDQRMMLEMNRNAVRMTSDCLRAYLEPVREGGAR